MTSFAYFLGECTKCAIRGFKTRLYHQLISIVQERSEPILPNKNSRGQEEGGGRGAAKGGAGWGRAGDGGGGRGVGKGGAGWGGAGGRVAGG